MLPLSPANILRMIQLNFRLNRTRGTMRVVSCITVYIQVIGCYVFVCRDMFQRGYTQYGDAAFDNCLCSINCLVFSFYLLLFEDLITRLRDNS